jgi:hypothetical protein
VKQREQIWREAAGPQTPLKHPMIQTEGPNVFFQALDCIVVVLEAIHRGVQRVRAALALDERVRRQEAHLVREAALQVGRKSVHEESEETEARRQRPALVQVQAVEVHGATRVVRQGHGRVAERT